MPPTYLNLGRCASATPGEIGRNMPRLPREPRHGLAFVAGTAVQRFFSPARCPGARRRNAHPGPRQRLCGACPGHNPGINSRIGKIAQCFQSSADENGSSLINALARQQDSDLRIIGIFDDRSEERAPATVAGHQKLGTIDDLVRVARRTRIDLVLVSLPISAENRILEMLKKLWVLPVDIRLAAHNAKLRFRPRAYSYVGNVPVLDVADKPITDWDVVVKWLFDRIVGAIALIAASPIMLLTALAIKLDSRGPVFFKQKRYGFNNELIEVYKFRSMLVDRCDAMAAKLVSKGDPRLTRIGAFIRKASIDELPQLINVVFMGNLSLVGPRPHALHAKAADRLYDEAVDGYFARHRVKPGITGWAQINGWRGETDTEEKIQRRVEHDVYYIENWSVLLDLYILAKTPLALASAKNAY
jgi:Undecaprenyl-phosphate glucose phosphotransferase